MHRIIASALVLLAAAPVAAAAPSVDKASKDQIVASYDGNTLYQETSYYEFAGYYDANGTARGRGWSWLGEERSAGEWHVTDDGKFCMRWDRKDWGGGNENCYTVELQGDKTSLIHIAGEGSEDRTFTILKGNPYDL